MRREEREEVKERGQRTRVGWEKLEGEKGKCCKVLTIFQHLEQFAFRNMVVYITKKNIAISVS